MKNLGKEEREMLIKNCKMNLIPSFFDVSYILNRTVKRATLLHFFDLTHTQI